LYFSALELNLISLHRDLSNLGRANKYETNFEPVDFGDELDRMADAITVFPWSHVQWFDGGRRLGSRFARAVFCPLDFDEGQMTLDEARGVFADYMHIIGLTKSHQIAKEKAGPCDRFRVVLCFESIIDDVKIFKATMEYWVKNFKGTDKKCKDAARFFCP
jgi:hypothetical protein